ASRAGLNTHKPICRIQASDALRGGNGRIAECSAAKNDLWRLRAVGYVRVKCEREKRMVVEQPIRCANRSLSILEGVPCEANTRSYVIRVTRNPLSDSERILCRRGNGICCSKCRRELNVITGAIV